MINIDVLCYFLDKNQFSFGVKGYDNSIMINTMRHFDATSKCTHALVIINETDKTLMSPIISDTIDASCIVVYITQSLPADTATLSFPCPVVTIHTTELFKLLNTLVAMMEAFNRWEQNLRLFDLTSKNYQELIDYSDEILELPFSLLDKDFVYIAYSKERSEEMGYIAERVENGRLSIKIAAQMMSTPGFEDLEHYTDVFEFEDDYHFMGLNIHHDGRYVARLVMMHAKNPWANAYHKYIFKRLGQVITTKYDREGTFYINQEPTHLLRMFVKNALDGHHMTDIHWSQALAEKDWVATDGFALMVFDATYRREKKLHSEYLCPQIENMWHFTAATEWNEKTVILINQKHLDKNFEQSLAYFVRDNLLTAGISRPFTDISKLSDYYTQASIAMEIGIKESPHLWYYFFDQYAISYLKQQCTMHMPPEVVCHPALIQLQEYDAKNGSNYFDSLRLFIQTQYNMSAAADLSFVHRTTFIKRMERIIEITGIDLTDWNTRMYLMLSYLLL